MAGERGATLVAEAAGWVADGARLVGGCCQVLPAEIAAMKVALETDGAERRGRSRSEISQRIQRKV